MIDHWGNGNIYTDLSKEGNNECQWNSFHCMMNTNFVEHTSVAYNNSLRPTSIMWIIINNFKFWILSQLFLG